jgi:hypothetical protein
MLSREDLSSSVCRMVAAAAARPELRRLFPYLSLSRHLRFSRTTEWPYSEGLPSLHFIDPNFVLDGPTFELHAGDGAAVAQGELVELLDRLVALLPVAEEETES